jgi:peroxiredoxin
MKRVVSHSSFALLLCGCAFLGLAGGCRSSRSEGSIADFTLPDVRGGAFHLRAQPEQPVLLAFLQTVPDTADTPSRGEVAFLQSMDHQYRGRGLRVAVIDASALASGRQPDRNAVINASYDWQLQIPLLLDDGNRVAHSFKVTQVPTMVLLTADGKTAQRWEGFTRPAMLAQGIEKVVGGPLGQLPDLSEPGK